MGDTEGEKKATDGGVMEVRQGVLITFNKRV